MIYFYTLNFLLIKISNDCVGVSSSLQFSNKLGIREDIFFLVQSMSTWSDIQLSFIKIETNDDFLLSLDN